MASLDHIALSTIHQVAACHGEQPLMEMRYDFETGATDEHELGEGGDRAATRKHLAGIIEGLAALFPEDGNQQKAILAGVARGLAYRAMSAVERAQRATLSMDALCGDRAPSPEAKARPVVAYSVGAD